MGGRHAPPLAEKGGRAISHKNPLFLDIFDYSDNPDPIHKKILILI